jgi:toxin secretion/phage lysis holin
MMKFQSLIDNKLILIYTWAVFFDLVTGFIKSLSRKSTNSTKGLSGLLKHALLLIAILTLYPMFDLIGMGGMGDTFLIFYILFYLVSIVENWGQMGLPVPEWVKRYLYKLSDDYNKDDKGGK